LLILLATNPDRVFTKDELFDRVWGIDALGDLATLTVHIRKIREKIEADPSNPQYVETIWGVGYRLRA
jgi:two-component system, OmpR family, response regulator